MTAQHPFVEVADRIGCRLYRDALWAGARCNWLGWGADWDGRQVVSNYRAQPLPVYDGTAGIALFLSRLVRVTGDPRQQAILRGALHQLDKATDGRAASLGFYSGTAGMACAFLNGADALGEPRWVDRGLALLSQVAQLDPDPIAVDVMRGSAGSIPMLLYAAARYARDDLLAAAAAHGEHLLRTAVRSDAGWSWDCGGGMRLIGYAHGAAGIACALLELRRALNDERYGEAATEALRFERSHFNADKGNWPDLRTGAGGQGAAADASLYPAMWCHGSAGVGLARLRIRDLAGDEPELRRDLDAALAATQAALTQPIAQAQGYCLCHGAAGQADLLIEAAQRLDHAPYRQVAEAVGQTGLSTYHANDLPWPCGVPARGETPNLMLGLAGIGYFYLRLAAPESVPSILILGPELVPAANAGRNLRLVS
jgi:lantibiotic modifying enzyme